MTDTNEPNDTIIASIFGFSATALSLMFFISPIRLFLEARKTHCLKNIPGLMLISNYLNCVLWIFYGFGKKQTPQWLCNIIGLTFNLVWLIWYVVLKNRKDFVQRILGISFFIISYIWTIILGLFIYSKEKDWQKVLIDILGYSACAINVIMYAAPGQNIVCHNIYILL
jgi:hypothetical protein